MLVVTLLNRFRKVIYNNNNYYYYSPLDLIYNITVIWGCCGWSSVFLWARLNLDRVLFTFFSILWIFVFHSRGKYLEVETLHYWSILFNNLSERMQMFYTTNRVYNNLLILWKKNYFCDCVFDSMIHWYQRLC